MHVSLLAYQFHECILIIILLVLLLAHLRLRAPRHAHARVVVHTGHLLICRVVDVGGNLVMYCVFRSKPPLRLTHSALRRRRSKQTGWRGRISIFRHHVINSSDVNVADHRTLLTSTSRQHQTFFNAHHVCCIFITICRGLRLLGGISRSAMSSVWLHVASQSLPIGYLSSYDIGCEHNADSPASVSMILSDQQMTVSDCYVDEMLQPSSISLGPKCNSAGDIHL